jgi:transcription factor SFP1
MSTVSSAMVPVWLTEISSIIMQGTSPFAYQTPSFHSSSYLPKLEANFMRDFSCCGLTIPGLHELLQHYEEQHTHQTPPSSQRQISVQPDSKAAIAAGAAAAVQERAQHQTTAPSGSKTAFTLPPNSAGPTASRHMQQSLRPMGTDMPPTQVLAAHDMDTVQDMEMDDETMVDLPPQYSIQDRLRVMQRSQFGQPQPTRVPPLDLTSLNMNNALQSHQGLRHSTPTTPVAAGRIGNLYQNNPTVSSVNTPTLMAHPRQQQHCLGTPDSSLPGTPSDLNKNFDFSYNQGPISHSSQLVQDQYHRYGQYGLGNGADVSSLCIDDPGNRLLSRDGGFNTVQQASTKLSDGAYSEDSELARTIREQQRLAGVPDPQLDDPDVPKPFHCPVIGCEKAYKNQNGLKYHKSVGRPFTSTTTTYRLINPSTATMPNDWLQMRTEPTRY